MTISDITDIIKESISENDPLYVSSDHLKVSVKTVKNCINRMGLNIKNAEIKTDAYLVTENDIRNALSTAILFESICRNIIAPELLINYDAIQFVVD